MRDDVHGLEEVVESYERVGEEEDGLGYADGVDESSLCLGLKVLDAFVGDVADRSSCGFWSRWD